jgi:hypothetical protein
MLDVPRRRENLTTETEKPFTNDMMTTEQEEDEEGETEQDYDDG